MAEMDDNNWENIFINAWSRLGNGENLHAEELFRQVIDLNPQVVDGWYGLGLALKVQGRKEEAIRCFQKALELIEIGLVADRTRRSMVRRLALGHINLLRNGNWNLEKEFWQKNP